jgi:hypothetical protein
VELYIYSLLYVHGISRTTLPLRDIGGEVAWILSAETAYFYFCEHGYDPYVRIKCNVFLYQMAGYYVDLKNESVSWSSVILSFAEVMPHSSK